MQKILFWAFALASVMAVSARALKMALDNRACLGAGCYWGTEKFIKKDFNEKIAPGSILQGFVGFMGPPGAKKNPTYRDVCTGSTGQVEVYDCIFDGKEETYEKLLKHFFTFHDPTTTDRQGNDRGTQYASVIFCYDDKQKAIANKVKAELQDLINKRKVTSYQDKTVSTAIREATTFYPAQDDHQRYLEKNPWGYCNHAYRFKDWPK